MDPASFAFALLSLDLSCSQCFVVHYSVFVFHYGEFVIAAAAVMRFTVRGVDNDDGGKGIDESGLIWKLFNVLSH